MLSASYSVERKKLPGYSTKSIWLKLLGITIHWLYVSVITLHVWCRPSTVLKVHVKWLHENYVQCVPQGTNLRSGNMGCLIKSQPVRTECFKNSYFNRIGRIWNVLDRNLRDTHSHNYFNKGIKVQYQNKLNTFSTDRPCSWSSTCRCQSCLCNIVSF